MVFDSSLVKKAYKKLKSSVYYDKTQLILRDAIVNFENDEDFEWVLEQISDALHDADRFEELAKRICNSIGVTAVPKKLENDKTDIISNAVSEKIEIKEVQYYINMPVEGHILGVLWIFAIGSRIDKDIYLHSYGNRIRKNLINELSSNPTYSPYLFDPYFERYESWRDTAMSKAQRLLDEKQDAVIITMDFKRYYYSLDVNEDVLCCLFESAGLEKSGESVKFMETCRRLNYFVDMVISRYSSLFDSLFEERHILPIGFLPSNIIGNWCLKNFDKAIIDGWNPVYYGRYVDDILIVDKVEHNCSLFEKAQNNNLTKSEIIQFFLINCTKWTGMGTNLCGKESGLAVVKLNEELTRKEKQEKQERTCDNIQVYSVNSRYNPCGKNKSEIVVHNDKVRIFYFKAEEADELITCFKGEILKNKSEFRYLPEDEAVFENDDFSEVYSLSNEDTINKLRGINDICLDKYKLSKLLGKYLRIGGMIKDKSELFFEKEILRIFNLRTIIENYSMWEKVIEILVINERFDALVIFCEKIHKAINSICDNENTPVTLVNDIKQALYGYLVSGLCRSFALVWKKERCEKQKIIFENIFEKENVDGIDELIYGYLKTRMMDKSVMPILFDMLNIDKIGHNAKLNLTHFNEVINIVNKKYDNNYIFYPYLISKYDYSMISCIEEMNKEKAAFSNVEDIIESEYKRFLWDNYHEKSDDYNNPISVVPYSCNKKCFEIIVGNSNKNKLRVAIANVQLKSTNFERIILDNPDRSYHRYKELSQIVNMAIKNKVDMLIMPEAYVPYEWLPVLARSCAKNSMAVVTGVEHVKINSTDKHSKDRIFNFTATILPYYEDEHKCANISFHLKNHYAPFEREKIEGYRMQPVEGEHYELYKWNDCYFAVYCCYELTSIIDRSLFQSKADMIVTVEWNKDVKYYSNIMESLSRDLHCYCVQVNSSEYGDSRITKPSKSEEKDIIRTKGGINSSILVDDIDISLLRNFQIKEYSLQQKDSSFKSTPPDFDKGIVLKKIKGLPLDDRN